MPPSQRIRQTISIQIVKHSTKYCFQHPTHDVNRCWCGGCELLVAGPGRYDRHGTASCAGFPCSGDATQTCGGIYAFSLYYRGTCGRVT